MQNFSLRTAVILAATTLLLLGGLSSCSQRQRWRAEERKATNEMLRDWRHMVYLSELSEEEFELFANRVTDVLEEKYPSYVEFVEMPMMGDSVEMVVIATIVTDIKASPEKMRYIFPYETLVRTGFLPSDMSRRHQDDFYRCFAGKVNTAYGSIQQFIWDAIYSQLDDYLIAHMMTQCATPYWDEGEGSMTVIVEED